MFLSSGEYLNILRVMIVDMDTNRIKLSDIDKGEIHLERPHALVFPTNPLVAWKWRKEDY